MIYGARIRQARELREVLQQDLAGLLGISGSRLAQIERDSSHALLGSDEQARLSEALRLPISFFEVPVTGTLSEGSMRFRARKTLTKRTLNRARREAELAHELAHVCAARMELPAPRLPSSVSVEDIETAAEFTRASLGVPPDEPVEHVTHALERAGTWIFLIDMRVDRRLDAFSTWVGEHLERPLIAVGEGLCWDRQRHTLAHELAHLVLHRAIGDDESRGKEAEREADRFASAFLMPRTAALEELPQPLTLSQLGTLKLRWGMSYSSLIMRSADLGLIDGAQVTSLMKQMSARKWTTREPGEDARAVERPRALRRMAEVAFGDPIDIKRLAGQVGRYSVDVARDLDRYAAAPARRARRDRTSSPAAPADNVVELSPRRRRAT